MPVYQQMVEKLNEKFNRWNIDAIPTAELTQGKGPLGDIADKLGVLVDPQNEIKYLNDFPEGEQEALRAALYSAVTRAPRVPVQFAWAPAAEGIYEVHIWEVSASGGSSTAMTVLIRSLIPK